MPRKPRNSPNPTGRPPRLTCRRCGAPGRIGEGLSVRGLCDPCAQSATIQAIIEMRHRRGPIWRRYIAGLAGYVERELERDRISERGSRDPVSF